MHHSRPHCTHIHHLVSQDVLQTPVDVSGCHFFPHGGIKWHAFASSVLPCQMPVCQSAPLLSSVTQQENGTEYCWEGWASTAVPPTSASDIMGHDNNIGGINFRAALLYTHIYFLATESTIQKYSYLYWNQACDVQCLSYLTRKTIWFWKQGHSGAVTEPGPGWRLQAKHGCQPAGCSLPLVFSSPKLPALF